MDHLSLTNSSGRRVSLLNDSANNNGFDFAAPSTPPRSPDHSDNEYMTHRKARSESFNSTASAGQMSMSSAGAYSPRTPPNLPLPTFDKMMPLHETSFFAPLPAPPQTMNVDSHESSHTMSPPASNASSSPTPANSAAPAAAKRPNRRYACPCGKSFTTSGHLARHTRIHTGEKNYVCPFPSCGARFSRQDNCMQHFRTHTSSSSKRSARRRRMASSEPTLPRLDTLLPGSTGMPMGMNMSPMSMNMMSAPAMPMATGWHHQPHHQRSWSDSAFASGYAAVPVVNAHHPAPQFDFRLAALANAASGVHA